MNVIYYPNMVVSDVNTLKSLILFWGNIKSLVPEDDYARMQAYLKSETNSKSKTPLNRYKKIYDLANEKIIGFQLIKNEDRRNASKEMRKLLVRWNKNAKLFDHFRIQNARNFAKRFKPVYWLRSEKMEHGMINQLTKEKLLVKDGENLYAWEEIGKSYMSILAGVIKERTRRDLITDDDFCVSVRTGSSVNKQTKTNDDEYDHDDRKEYQVVSLGIPELFVDKKKLDRIPLKKIIEIRKDLYPLSKKYFREVKKYQRKINNLAAEGSSDESFEVFCEFCSRVAISFTTFSKEAGKISRLFSNNPTWGYVTGMLFPAMKLSNPDPAMNKILDIAQLGMASATNIINPSKNFIGFEFLEKAYRKINRAAFKDVVTRILPKIKKH